MCQRILKSAADPQHVEVAGTATATAAAAPLTGGCVRWCRRGRSRLGRAFGADQNNPVVLGVERRGFAARLGWHGLFHGKARGAAFLDDRSEEHTSEFQSLTNLVCRL